MAEFVQLKPRIRIQTVIHFECPDRATFFAEYSRQLRRGEIFLEVAQKIPVGTIVDVRFRFQDCDATVELSGEIYRHRRKLDRLEAAVQFLDPDALQHLLSLSETDLGPGEASAITARLRDRLSEDDQVDLSVEGLAELEEQDTTKLPSLDAVPPGHNGERSAHQRSKGTDSGIRQATSRPGAGPAEDEDLDENTKALPSWGAHWLGIEGGGKPPQDASPSGSAAPSKAPQASADDERRSATAELRAGIADSSPMPKLSGPVQTPPGQDDEGEVDMDEWDWNFLQSSPAPDPDTIDEQPRFKAVPLDLSEDIGVDSLLGPPGNTPIPDSEDADPDLVEFASQAPEFEPDRAAEMDDAQLDAWTLEPAGTADAPPLPDDPFASWNPKAASTSSSSRNAELNSLLDPILPDPIPASSPDATGSGEWPSVEEPFRGDMEPLEPNSDDEFVEPRRSGLGSKLALLLVAMLLLGGTAAVVLQPDWFSSLLSGGDVEDSGQDPRGTQQARRATPVAPKNQALISETPATTESASAGTEGSPAIPAGTGADTVASPSAGTSDTPSQPRPTVSTAEPETIDLDADESVSRTAQASVAAFTPAAIEPTPRPAAQFRSPVPPTPSTSSGLDEDTAPSGGPAGLRGVDVAVDGQDVVLRIALVGAVDRVVQSEAASPPRLIFDLVEVSAPGAPSPRNVGQNGIERVRFGLHDRKLRIVVDVKGTLPRADIVRNTGEVTIRLKPGA